MITRKTMNRRSFAASAAASVMAMPLITRVSAQQGSPASAETSLRLPVVTLGSTRAEWDEAAGAPQHASDLVEYVSPIDGVTPVLVGFTDDFATFMEYRFGDDALSQTETEKLLAGSIPAEGMIGDQFMFDGATEETGPYHAQILALPSEVPSPGAIIIKALQEADPAADVRAISIAASSEPDLEIAITGDPGGIALDRNAWIAAYGEPPETNYEVEAYPGVGPQSMDVTVTYMPQDDVVRKIHANGDQLDVLAATRVSAQEYLGASVPADAEPLQHFYLPATEGGPLALRFFTFMSEEAGVKLHNKRAIGAMFHERADDPEPMVTRIDLAATEM